MGASETSDVVDWDRLARAYPRQAWLERSSLATMLSILGPNETEKLLDVGTGTAELLQNLSRMPGRPAEAIGIDPSPAMLGRAGELPRPWKLMLANGESLPFADESFDIVTASYLLHVLEPPSRRRVIAECVRVLRPEGRFGTITIAPPSRTAARLITAPVRWAAERYPSRLIGLRPLDPLPELEDAGLTELRRRRDLRGYPALCIVAGKPGSEISP